MHISSRDADHVLVAIQEHVAVPSPTSTTRNHDRDTDVCVYR